MDVIGLLPSKLNREDACMKLNPLETYTLVPDDIIIIGNLEFLVQRFYLKKFYPTFFLNSVIFFN